MPGPKAIDPRSGFEIPHENLARQWDNELVDRKRVDKRHPQEFVRARPEKISLPYSRPEPPDRGIAQPIFWEDGLTPIVGGGTEAWLTEGVVPVL